MNDSRVPTEFGEVFKELSQEIAGLHIRWKMYRQLYGQDQERIDLLNKTARNFFWRLRNILLDDTILGISRVTDPPRTGRKSNLVLAQLIECLDSNEYEEIKDKLLQVLKRIEGICEPLRTNRNKRIAHLNLDSFISDSDYGIPGVSRMMVEEALRYIRGFMNIAEQHFYDSTTAYEAVVTFRDADSLMGSLRKAIHYDDAIQKGLISRRHLGEK